VRKNARRANRPTNPPTSSRSIPHRSTGECPNRAAFLNRLLHPERDTAEPQPYGVYAGRNMKPFERAVPESHAIDPDFARSGHLERAERGDDGGTDYTADPQTNIMQLGTTPARDSGNAVGG
jgi:hypothetical protein